MLNDTEQLLLEAIQTMLSHEAKLGLAGHNAEHEEIGKVERGLEYLHQQIDEMFALRTSKSNFAENLSQAFTKAHTYCYLEDPNLIIAMERDLKAQGIPAEDRQQAKDTVRNILEELKSDREVWAEKDFGFHPDLDEIREVSQPDQGY